MRVLVYEDIHCYNAMRVKEIADNFDVKAFIAEEGIEGECINYAVIEGDHIKVKQDSLDLT